MKKQFLMTTILLSIACVAFQSCKKSEETAPVTPPVITPVTPPAPVFTWKEDGGAIITADSAYWTTGTWGTGIRSYKGGSANFFEINWVSPSDISVGTKILEIPYGFTFVKATTTTYTCATNQNLNISASSGNKISGNCTASVTGGTIVSVEITFTDLPKKY